MKLDLDAPVLQQGDALAVNPGLKQPNLQQWFARGIVQLPQQHPGKAANRRLSMLDVIGISFIHETNKITGLGPKVCAEVVPDMLRQARRFVRDHPPTYSDERPDLPYPLINLRTADWSDYARIAIFKNEEGKTFFLEIEPDEHDQQLQETTFPVSYMVFQQDRFFAKIINKLLMRLYERGDLGLVEAKRR